MDNSKHLHTTLNSTGLRHLREMVRIHYVQDWVKVVLQVPFSEMPIEIIFYLRGYSWTFEQELCVRLVLGAGRAPGKRKFAFPA